MANSMHYSNKADQSLNAAAVVTQENQDRQSATLMVAIAQVQALQAVAAALTRLAEAVESSRPG
jgi:hypothetical protein